MKIDRRGSAHLALEVANIDLPTPALLEQKKLTRMAAQNAAFSGGPEGAMRRRWGPFPCAPSQCDARHRPRGSIAHPFREAFSQNSRRPGQDSFEQQSKNHG